MAKIIDTHCHYNLEPLYSGQRATFKIKDDDPILQSNWRNEWQKSKENGIEKSIVVGANLQSSQLALSIAKQDKQLFAAVGIHPEDAKFNNQNELNELIKELKILAQMPKVVAIGETGLDYYYLEHLNNQELAVEKLRQKTLFIEEIKLANQLNLPLIVHLRDQANKIDAHRDCLLTLKEFWQFKMALIFHCASGTPDSIKEAMNLEKSYFGFDGNLTFKNAQKLRDLFILIQNSNPEKILLETDSPYLAPVPYRGKICEPWMISVTAEFAVMELKADLDQIYQNSLKAFNLNKYHD